MAKGWFSVACRVGPASVFLSVVCFQILTAFGATHLGAHTKVSMGCDIPATSNAPNNDHLCTFDIGAGNSAA